MSLERDRETLRHLADEYGLEQVLAELQVWAQDKASFTDVQTRDGALKARKYLNERARGYRAFASHQEREGITHMNVECYAVVKDGLYLSMGVDWVESLCLAWMFSERADAEYHAGYRQGHVIVIRACPDL